MAGFVFILLLLAMASHSCATWCICKDGNDSILQKTLDYACGAGADCNPIHTNGPCYNPNSVRAHCSYAVNSYFQRNRQLPTACDFSGTATIITSDPSVAGCAYPASATTTTPVSGTPISGTVTPTTTVPNGGGSPLVTTPNGGGGGGGGGGGILGGGVNNGLGPSGINTDMSQGETLLPKSIIIILLFCSSIILTFSGLIF